MHLLQRHITYNFFQAPNQIRSYQKFSDPLAMHARPLYTHSAPTRASRMPHHAPHAIISTCVDYWLTQRKNDNVVFHVTTMSLLTSTIVRCSHYYMEWNVNAWLFDHEVRYPELEAAKWSCRFQDSQSRFSLRCKCRALISDSAFWSRTATPPGEEELGGVENGLGLAVLLLYRGCHASAVGSNLDGYDSSSRRTTGMKVGL